MDILYGFAANPEANQGGGGIAAFLPFFLIMLIIYFLMIRPQAKRQKEKQNMLLALKKGDKVITIGGIHGVVSGMKNQGKLIVLKIDKNLNININRSAISGLADGKIDEDTQLGGNN
ncbi:MAG: preprotein translocase subunit YajC [Candidatus Marinimicrobia bacterium]|mgnify:CR=1 FL=1|nr:preprotein translocase subunit YajC [Candidatus Neomarinimicrobiota bacterium]